MEQLVFPVELTGFILSIVSTVLAIVSIVFSAIFFWWGKKENDAAAQLTIKIEEKVACLERLFNKMYDSTYQIVRENNQAMQRHLFQSGSFESQNLENKDMDVTLLILSEKKIKKSAICSKLSITKETAEAIVKKLSDKGIVKVDTDEETVLAIDTEVGAMGSSGDGLGDDYSIVA